MCIKNVLLSNAAIYYGPQRVILMLISIDTSVFYVYTLPLIIINKIVVGLMHLIIPFLTLKSPGEWNVPTAFSKTCHFACDEVGSV